MAKKRNAKKAAPSKVQKGNSMGWIVAAIVVIVIIAYFVMKSGNQVPASTGNEPSQAPAAPGALTSATAPEMDKKCTVAIGVVPGSQVMNGDSLSVTFKDSGRVNVEGTYFEFVDASGKMIFRKNSDVVQPGATITYTVNLAEVSTELGSAVKTFIVYPIQNGLACDNQKAYVIKQ